MFVQSLTNNLHVFASVYQRILGTSVMSMILVIQVVYRYTSLVGTYSQAILIILNDIAIGIALKYLL